MTRNTSLIRDAGEYGVAFQLARLGITAALTPRNSKSVDILATVDGSKNLAIQVKASAGRHNHRGWDLGKNNPPKSSSLFYVFVNVWDDAGKEVDFLVVPSSVVAKGQNVRGVKRSQFFVHEAEYERYKNNWDDIKRFFGIE